MFKSCAILGATGLVGQELISIMDKDETFAFERLFLYSSGRTPNATFMYKGKSISVEPFDEKNIPQVDILFSSIDESLSKKYVPLFLERGAYVIDDSSAFRLEKTSALVVVGINDNLIRKSQKLYSQPNCVVIGLVYPVSLLMRKYPIRRIYVSTYQSISGAGKSAFVDFMDNLKSHLQGGEVSLKVFKNDPILNAVPVIPDTNFESTIFERFTREEEKILLETNKILGADFEIISTCVRISVQRGHSSAIFIEFENPIPEDITGIFKGCEYIRFSETAIFTPKYATGKDEVFICRIKAFKNTISFWATWDNLRIGSALNMWRIARKLAC